LIGRVGTASRHSWQDRVGDASACLEVGAAPRAALALTSSLTPCHLAHVPASDRPLYSILHTRYSRISACPRVTVPTCPLAASPRPCQHVNLSTGQLVNAHVPPHCIMQLSSTHRCSIFEHP
jgi:hypothetical protein